MPWQQDSHSAKNGYILRAVGIGLLYAEDGTALCLHDDDMIEGRSTYICVECGPQAVSMW